jgi:outer membrane protein assembly factor BamB
MITAWVRRWFGFPLRSAAWPLLAVATLLSSLVLAFGSSGPASAQGSADWPQFMFGVSHSSYNAAATSITTANLADLQPVWRWKVPAATNGASNGLYPTPVSVDGVLYIGSSDGDFYAVDEATGQILWSQFLGLQPGLECAKIAQGIVSTATVATDPSTGALAVYVNAPDGYLYALDPATGDVLWKEVVAIPSTTEDNYFAWSSPVVANGNVYVGIASRCSNPDVPAGLLGFNAGTGASLGEWHSLPDNEDGASVWSTPTVLPDGQVIAATGSFPANAQPAHSESIVRLNGSNLSLLDSWEVPKSQQTGDGDFGGSPTLFTADLNGTSTQMVGACNKNGVYYALQADDLSAGPVWQQTIAEHANDTGLCVAGAIWNGTDLIEGAGNQTTIDGTTYQGGMFALNPDTGAVVWATGLPGEIIGSPTEDGGGVVAAPVYYSATGDYGIYLLSAATGAILDYIPLADNPIFGQPVFAGNELLVDGLNPAVGVTAYEITTPGTPVTAVTPDGIGQGATETLTLTGSGFTGTPTVFVSSTEVQVDSVTVVSPTELSVRVTARTTAALGARDITVIEPGPIADTCTGCLTVDPAPTLTSVSPGAVGQQGSSTLTLTGTGFTSNSSVSFSVPGITAKTVRYVSPTSLSVTAVVGDSAPVGAADVTVTTPGGAATCSGCLTVDPHPAITKLSPNSVPGGAATTITVTGTNFVSGLTVTTTIPGATVGTPSSVTSTSLSVTVTVPADVTSGTYQLRLVNPDGGAAAAALSVG